MRVGKSSGKATTADAMEHLLVGDYALICPSKEKNQNYDLLLEQPWVAKVLEAPNPDSGTVKVHWLIGKHLKGNNYHIDIRQ